MTSLESPASSTVVKPFWKHIFWALIKASILLSNEISPKASSIIDIGPSIRTPVSLPFFESTVPLVDVVLISIPAISKAFWLTK